MIFVYLIAVFYAVFLYANEGDGQSWDDPKSWK